MTDHAAETGKRWYVPAYQAQNGNVIAVGDPTVIREHAQQRVDEEDQADWPGGLFLATRIESPWARLGLTPTTPNQEQNR